MSSNKKWNHIAKIIWTANWLVVFLIGASMIIKHVDLADESNRMISNRANNNFPYGLLLALIGFIGCFSIYRNLTAIACLILFVGGFINLITSELFSYDVGTVGWFIFTVGILGGFMIAIDHSRGSGSDGSGGSGCSGGGCGGGCGGCGGGE